MLEPLVGQISIFAGDFAPKDWAFCDGSLAYIRDYKALFSLLGTTYGGDGNTTFGLPDLRGRAPLMFGQGPGLSNYTEGLKGGVSAVTLTAQEMATHDHMPLGSNNVGSTASPENAVWAASGGRGRPSTYVNDPGPPPVSGPMSPAAIGNTGGGAAHNNLPPYLALNYIIALVGVLPPRK